MLERKLIYYPTILTPSKWLKWAVLYWDKVSSIVPSGWEDNPPLSNSVQRRDYENMAFLWKEDVFNPARPLDVWRSVRRGGMLENDFEEILDSAEFLARINKNWKKNPMFRISVDKMSRRIIRLMQTKRLAVQDEKDSGWYFAEENASLLYMSLLAKHLADTYVDYVVPSTDWKEYETTIFHSGTKTEGFPSFNSEFIGVLPSPRDDVSLKDILRFRKRRRDELLQFRELIDKFHEEISQARNESEIKHTLVRYKEKIEKGRSNLSNSMKNSGVKTAYASVRSLIGMKSPAFAETIGFSIAKVPLNIAVPIVAGTALIQVGYEWVNNRNKRSARLSKSPFSYLYYARKEKVA